MKIKAAVVREKAGPFVIEDIELEEPRDDELLVRIVGSGICHTDLSARDQLIPVPLPYVFGHEGSGVVEKVGRRITKARPGDHVVLSFDSCGVCPACLRGSPTRCSVYFPLNLGGSRLDGSSTMQKNGEVIHGAFNGQSAFASHSLVHERSVVKVPKDAPLEILGPLGCAVMTGAGGVMEALRPSIGSSIAVFGMGPVGLSAILGAVVQSCSIIVAVDINGDRLKMAREFGATHAVNASTADPVEETRKIIASGVDYSLDCTGIAKVFRNAVDVLAIGGVCGMIGVPPVGVEVTLDMLHVMNGRAIRGVIMGDSVADIIIPQLMELHRMGKFPFDRMIKFYPFEEINQAAEDAEKGRTLKAVLRL